MALATPIYIVAGFALTARLNSVLLNRIFQKYVLEEGGAGHVDQATA